MWGLLKHNIYCSAKTCSNVLKCQCRIYICTYICMYVCTCMCKTFLYSWNTAFFKVEGSKAFFTLYVFFHWDSLAADWLVNVTTSLSEAASAFVLIFINRARWHHKLLEVTWRKMSVCIVLVILICFKNPHVFYFEKLEYEPNSQTELLLGPHWKNDSPSVSFRTVLWAVHFWVAFCMG